MSLTGNDELYAALHEFGANDFMAAIYAQRGRYFNYGSKYYVSSTSVHATNLPPDNGPHWKARFSLPRIDFRLATPPSNSALTVAVNQFLLTTRLAVTVGVPPFATALPVVDVRVVGEPVVNSTPPGSMSFQVVQTEILPNLPSPWDVIVNNLVTTLLNGVLPTLTFPYPAFSFGAFTATISNGPGIDQNQLDFQGNL